MASRKIWSGSSLVGSPLVAEHLQCSRTEPQRQSPPWSGLTLGLTQSSTRRAAGQVVDSYLSSIGAAWPHRGAGKCRKPADRVVAARYEQRRVEISFGRMGPRHAQGSSLEYLKQ